MRQIKIPGQRQLGAQEPGLHHLPLLGPDAGTVIQNAVAPVDGRLRALQIQTVQHTQRAAQCHGTAGGLCPRGLQIADGQIVVHRRGGNLGGGARVIHRVRLAQDPAAQTQQALTPAQQILLAGQIALLAQGRAVDRHPHIGGVIRQADEQIIAQGAPPLGIGPQQILRRKHAGRTVGKLGVQLLLAPGQRVQQTHRRCVHAHRVGAAVHTVHHRHTQHGQPHPRHAGQKELRHQRRTFRQGVKRHAAPQRLTVQLKQPGLNGQAIGPGRAALQQRILPPVRAVALHRAHRQQLPMGVPGQRQIAVAPDGRKVKRAVSRHRLQQALAAHQRILHGGFRRAVQRRHTAAGRPGGIGRQAGLILRKDRAAELAHNQRRQPRGGILAGARGPVVQIQPFPQGHPHFYRRYIAFSERLLQISLHFSSPYVPLRLHTPSTA